MLLPFGGGRNSMQGVCDAATPARLVPRKKDGRTCPRFGEARRDLVPQIQPSGRRDPKIWRMRWDARGGTPSRAARVGVQERCQSVVAFDLHPRTTNACFCV